MSGKYSFSLKLSKVLHCFLIGLLSFKLSEGLNVYTNRIGDNDRPTVLTKTGPIAGKFITVLNTKLATFQGIPFAKPPIGERRFKKPEPIDKWREILVAEEKSPACMQYSTRNYGWIAHELDKSEDCLYLNVWTPANFKTSNKMAVMVWIHGGSFFGGSASQEMYDGGVITALSNIVFVNMNFRLGVFGLFNGGTTEAPGNILLLDQLMALKWVKKNIRYFGGDPNKITLIGQSSGSIAVSVFSVSPLSKGLFQAGIMQSNSPINQFADEDVTTSIKKSNTIAEIVGCANQTVNLNNNPAIVIECMKNENALKLSKAENRFTSKFPDYFFIYFGPSCDDCNPFLPEPLFQMFRKPIRVPLIIGDTQNEANKPVLNYIQPNIFPFDSEPNITEKQMKKKFTQILTLIPSVPVKKVKEMYLKNINEDDIDALVNACSIAVSDFGFNCPSLFLAEKLKKGYLYWFTHRSAKDDKAKWVRVPHGSDLPYTFGKPMLDTTNFTDEDRCFTASFIEKLTNFAKYHSPRSTPRWTKFHASNPKAYQMEARNPGMIPYPRKKPCEFWRPILLGNSSSSFTL